MQNILAILYGIVFGIANIIPGVSGGTMLVVFGCYDKVCGALTLDFKEIKKHFKFLVFFGIGAVIGIVGFAFIITWLFTSFPIQTNMFFMGLIIGSIPLIIRNATVKEKFRPTCIIPFIIGLAAVVGLAVAQQSSTDLFRYEINSTATSSAITIFNDTDRTVESWTLEMNVLVDNGTVSGAEAEVNLSTTQKIKNLFGAELDVSLSPNMFKNIDGVYIEPNSSYTFIYDGILPEGVTPELNVSYKMDVKFFLTMMAALFIAAIAMIIPGVSGSFVMVTLGVYSTIIAAIKDLNIPIIIPCAIGAVLGLVAGARLITWLMKKYSLMVYSAILGLVAGSMYVILPSGFGLNIATLMGFICLIIGAFIAITVGKNTKVGE